MISETMPLNEWPIELLNSLRMDLELAYSHWSKLDGEPVTGTLTVLIAVNKAIKDQEFETQKS